MEVAMFWVQIIATAVITATLVIYSLQLFAIRRATEAQGLLSLFNYLQSDGPRLARTTILDRLQKLPFTEWSQGDRQVAATVCASYNLAAMMAKQGLVSLVVIAENWAPTIVRCYEVCLPFINERRSDLGPSHWAGFSELYNEAKKQVASVASPNKSPHSDSERR